MGIGMVITDYSLKEKISLRILQLHLSLTPSKIRTVISADFDNDGFDEIFMNNIGEPNKLFKILDNGKVKEISIKTALEPNGLGTGAAVADIDNDGILELLISHGEVGLQKLTLYRANIEKKNLLELNL